MLYLVNVEAEMFLRVTEILHIVRGWRLTDYHLIARLLATPAHACRRRWRGGGRWVQKLELKQLLYTYLPTYIVIISLILPASIYLSTIFSALNDFIGRLRESACVSSDLAIALLCYIVMGYYFMTKLCCDCSNPKMVLHRV